MWSSRCTSALYTKARRSYGSLPLKGRLSLSLQLHCAGSFHLFSCSSLLFWAATFDFTFGTQLYDILRLQWLNSLPRSVPFLKCLSMKDLNLFPILVSINWLNGGLNHKKLFLDFLCGFCNATPTLLVLRESFA